MKASSVSPQFLLSWLVFLDSVPEDGTLLKHLPQILDALFALLKDNDSEVRATAQECLSRFLKEIKIIQKDVDLAAIIQILHTPCQSTHQLTKSIATEWMTQLQSLTSTSL